MNSLSVSVNIEKLNKGLVISLVCHIFLLMLFVPVLKNESYMRPRSHLVFLGSFLTEADVMPSVKPQAKIAKAIFLEQRDFSKGAYQEKGSLGGMLKPNVDVRQAIAGKTTLPLPALPVPSAKVRENISFGFSDFAQYVYQADFADLKKMTLREELASFIDFKVHLNPSGEVLGIKKITGSGDPAFDLYVMYRLKKAIFRQVIIPRQGWLTVRFKIKD